MRGDWTLPNDAISAYLAGFGRYGIPFNAVYGPGAPAGVALPEILTRDAVLAALRPAAGTAPASAHSINQPTSESDGLALAPPWHTRAPAPSPFALRKTHP